MTAVGFDAVQGRVEWLLPSTHTDTCTVSIIPNRMEYTTVIKTDAGKWLTPVVGYSWTVSQLSSVISKLYYLSRRTYV